MLGLCHVRDDAIHLQPIILPVSKIQDRQPGRGVIRVDPAQDGGNIAEIASRRFDAQLQMQPADHRTLRRKFARAHRQLECARRGCLLEAQGGGGSQRIRVGAQDERLNCLPPQRGAGHRIMRRRRDGCGGQAEAQGASQQQPQESWTALG